jgi:hypothetical protein
MGLPLRLCQVVVLHIPDMDMTISVPVNRKFAEGETVTDSHDEITLIYCRYKLLQRLCCPIRVYSVMPYVTPAHVLQPFNLIESRTMGQQLAGVLQHTSYLRERC